MKKTTFQLSLAVSFLISSFALLAQGTHHDHEHGAHSHDHIKSASANHQTKLVTGQGEFIFSWDEELTAHFPSDAAEFEAAMHGGFNEDPQTGIVYTGIPGYGLCTISPDLKNGHAWVPMNA
ncbi:MAG: hypothetical protein IPL46_20850 [Saprospiraceae bacterium]|nr:hypothetical protein [Saprospiraceae bacterium]